MVTPMSSIVYLNGQYLPLEDAHIPILDRGFIFGDGVYEVIPVYNRHIFRLKEHIERLNKSLGAIYMENPYELSKWREILDKLVGQNGNINESLYIQITRGVSPRDHSIELATESTILVTANSLPKKDLSVGISAIVSEDIRWLYCNIKAITLLPSIMLRHKAKQSGAQEAILVRNGYVTEGAATNIFICKDSAVKTPVEDARILSGVTRNLVMELLAESDIPCGEADISEAELRDADEIWATSSNWEIVPIVKLDGQCMGDGRPGKMWERASAIYKEFKTKQMS